MTLRLCHWLNVLKEMLCALHGICNKECTHKYNRQNFLKQSCWGFSSDSDNNRLNMMVGFIVFMNYYPLLCYTFFYYWFYPSPYKDCEMRMKALLKIIVCILSKFIPH